MRTEKPNRNSSRHNTFDETRKQNPMLSLIPEIIKRAPKIDALRYSSTVHLIDEVLYPDS